MELALRQYRTRGLLLCVQRANARPRRPPGSSEGNAETQMPAACGHATLSRKRAFRFCIEL